MENNPINRDYVTYGRQFVTYKWYKPILVGLLTFVFYIVFSVVLVIVCGTVAPDSYSLFQNLAGGYDTMDVFTPFGVLLTMGGVAVMMPALYLASKIVKDRPYSSYISSGGGWRWNVFWKSMALAAVVYGLPILILEFIGGGGNGIVRFTVMGLIMLTIFLPFQCLAEEFVFRGLLVQTFGSWTKIPVLAIIVSAVIFALSHPYNIFGVLSILCSGLTFGLVAWIGNGVEVSGALHIINNAIGMYMTGFGLSTISSESTPASLAMSAAFDLLFLAAVIFADRKYHWFDEVKKDDVTPYNEKYAPYVPTGQR